MFKFQILLFETAQDQNDHQGDRKWLYQKEEVPVD